MTKKNATLYTTAILNGSWMLISIDAALWLHRSKGFKEVNIICFSNYNIFNIFNLLLRAKNFHFYFKINKLKKLLNFLKPSKAQNNNISEVSNFAIGKSDKATLIIGDLKIRFSRIKSKKKISA